MRWRRRGGEPPPSDAAPISPDDLAWRIGAADAPPARSGRHPTAGPGIDADGDRRRVAHAHRVVGGTAGRLILWRDASLVLLVVVGALLVAQVALPGGGGDATGSSGPGRSGPAVLGATGTPNGLGLPSIGPVVDPSLISGIEATATPRPTPRPTPRATPPPPAVTPGPTATPTTTPPPTPMPTDAPTTPPATTTPPTPPPPDPPTPPPPPQAAFNCVTSTGSLEIVCTDASVDAVSWTWEFGDGETSSAQSPQHTYLAPGPYTVRLTVTNPSGSDSVTQDVIVTG